MNQDLNIFNFLSRYYQYRLTVIIILIISSFISFAHYKMQKNEVTLILKFDKILDSESMLLTNLKKELELPYTKHDYHEVKFDYLESLSNFLVQNNYIKREEKDSYMYDFQLVPNFPVNLFIKIKNENIEKFTIDYKNIFINEYKKNYFKSEIENISLVNKNFISNIEYLEDLLKVIRDDSKASKNNVFFSSITDLALEITKLKNKLSIGNQIIDLIENNNKKQNDKLIMATYKVNNYNLSLVVLFFVYIFISLVFSIFLVAIITSYEDYKKINK